MKKKAPRELIFETLIEKSIVKKDVYKLATSVFSDFNAVAEEIAIDLKAKITEIDPRLEISYKEKGTGEFLLQIAGDVLVFATHTNVFSFDKSHQLWNSSYLKEEPSRAYCAVIHIYNFLSDSYEFHRMDDIGYLIARIFINKDKHYFVEGKRQLSFLYNDFANAVINKEDITSIIESAILYSMDFDLLTPPYDNVKQASVAEMQEWSKNLGNKTGKRLGFKFQADAGDIT
ncbi:MAG: hypothetical protein H0V01_06735 [Bacteroidetes bacterium]|nr:hypothetical protein [Bacteroidota bacterium]HET6244876.1 hypothetical protein [Bacteroidia bacterium]